LWWLLPIMVLWLSEEGQEVHAIKEERTCTDGLNYSDF
jgi:hypothetical protein